METQEQPLRPRLNPFAFPSETGFRFVLLIVLIISVCLSNFYALFLTTPSPFQRAYFATLEDCFRRFPLAPAPELAQSSSLRDLTVRLEEQDAGGEAVRNCYQPSANQLILRAFAATAAVLLVAFLIFQLSPRWTIHRKRLAPLSAEDVPEVVAFLDSLCAVLQLPRRPLFLWNPLDATRSAFTFGHLSNQYVAMSMGLVTQFYSNQAVFQAVLLHELSHLKNADLAKTQFATAVWYAFLLVAVLPGLLFSLFIDSQTMGFGPLAWSRLWQLALLTVLVYFVRNGILRVREYYADVRASSHLGDSAALGQVLAATPAQTTSRLRRAFALHPPTAQRIDVLDDTRPLFFATFEVAAITGVVMGIIYATNDLWATSLGPIYFGQSNALSLLMAVLLIGTVGLSVWRGATAELLYPPGRQRLGKISFGVGVGLFLGAQIIDMAGTLDFLETADPARILRLQLFLVVWALFGAAITYLLGLWSITCATAWSEYAASRHSPRIVYIVWFLVASVVAAIFVYPLTIAFAMGQSFDVGGLLILGAIPLYLLTPVAQGAAAKSALFIGIWALPLAAWLFRRAFHPIQTAPWGYLAPDATTSRPEAIGVSTTRLEFNIPFAVWSALAATAVFVGLLALKWIVRFGRGVKPGSNIDYGDSYGAFILAAAILLQVVLVVWVVLRTRQFRVSQALFASFILAVLMAIANNLINNVMETGEPFANPQFYWNDLHIFWGIGLLVSLPVAALANWIRGRGGHARPLT